MPLDRRQLDRRQLSCPSYNCNYCCGGGSRHCRCNGCSAPFPAPCCSYDGCNNDPGCTGCGKSVHYHAPHGHAPHSHRPHTHAPHSHTPHTHHPPPPPSPPPPIGCGQGTTLDPATSQCEISCDLSSRRILAEATGNDQDIPDVGRAAATYLAQSGLDAVLDARTFDLVQMHMERFAAQERALFGPPALTQGE